MFASILLELYVKIHSEIERTFFGTRRHGVDKGGSQFGARSTRSQQLGLALRLSLALGIRVR